MYFYVDNIIQVFFLNDIRHCTFLLLPLIEWQAFKPMGNLIQCQDFTVISMHVILRKMSLMLFLISEKYIFLEMFLVKCQWLVLMKPFF